MSSTTAPNYAWFLNKPSEVDSGHLDEYLASGRWSIAADNRASALIADIKVGDPVALKSVAAKRTGLDFFNADHPVSVLTIWATGRVSAVDTGSAAVSVEWHATSSPRDWYFYTAISPVWRVERGRRAREDALLDFAFLGTPQQIDEFLADPFWRDRYPAPPDFGWTAFYTEFADRLWTYRDRRHELVSLLISLAEDEPKLRYLVTDRYQGDVPGPITDMDPFSIMGAFNRGTTVENRRRVAGVLAHAFGVSAPVPDRFDGIPVVHNQSSWFIWFARDRNADDADTVWRVFGAGLGYADAPSEESRAEFVAAYDAAAAMRGIRWNLTQGLFWIRPRRFPTLEGQSRPFIAQRFHMDAPADGEGYLELADALLARFKSGTTSITSFPLLSYAAWSRPAAFPTEATVASLARWALRFAESIDLDADEMDYKRATATLMREARDRARGEDPTWPEAFKRALHEADNLLHYMAKDDVVKAIAADPSAWAPVLAAVWDDGGPASLDGLYEAMKGRLKRATPGNATALGALLLLGDDADANAPFAAEKVERWFKLTSWPDRPDTYSPTARYTGLLRLLDALRAEIAEQSGLEVSRLEAQSMAWAAIQYETPEDWASAERAACAEWRGGAGARPRRAWLVRSTNIGVDAAPWLADGLVALSATLLAELPAELDEKSLRAAVDAGYGQLDYAEREGLIGDVTTFAVRIAAGDVVCTRSDGILHIGEVTGAPELTDDGASRMLSRGVTWRAAIPDAETLPDRLTALFDQQGDVVDLTDARDVLEELVAFDASDDGLAPAPTPAATPDGTVLPPVDPDTARRVSMPVEPLQEIVDLLEARKQIVLYGPPGTGKTFVAMELARHIVGADFANHHQLVQFHPSYAYEDFFEGYRPTQSESGQPTFQIEPGPLRRIAADARKNPQRPFVLVIDEMNRANLAKVFGELYFLLEYRKQSIRLQYRPDEAFRLPENLFLIGTMNTADRSIALLDAAMRRRFAFLEMHPDEPPVRDVLSTFVGDTPGDRRPALLRALNAAIEESDRDFKIGPSYLMRADATTERGLDRIWRYDILPLLEEHYYGRISRTDVHATFGLAALRRSISTDVGDLPELG
ncbi:McrB family protein [Demequina maris]|uniref:McrB family protein n=1 Tax=Demequina maris TaxID=1638982 RepID=UPI000783C37D|nr:AAA family ATPase [Demequina maris]